MKRKDSRNGFTIVELVIVIAVVAILASVLVPSFGNVMNDAKESAATQEAKNAFTSYIINQPEQAGSLFLYQTGSWIVAIRDGQPIGIFDSRESAVIELGLEPDAEFADTGDGKLLVHKTSDAPRAPYAGKVISIFGDSISTYEGYIPRADGYNLEHLARYANNYEATGVTDVYETYWMQIIHQLGAKLGVNDSWRGAMVSGWSKVTTGVTVGEKGERASFADLQRIRNLGSNGTPDVILFYGGTNDLKHGNSLGSFDAATAPTEPDLTRKTVWDNLADAYCETLLRLKHVYPNTMIVAILPAETTNYYSADTLQKGNALMAQICEHYGVPYVDLRGKGVTVTNPGDDIHPNMAGMDRITELVMQLLLEQDGVQAGTNTVYSVTHETLNVSVSKGYFKGVSAGTSFEETITGAEQVVITMGGKDITAECYRDGVLAVSSVTGDLVIRATGVSLWYEHLKERPADANSATNLWTAVERENLYHTVNGWGNGGNPEVWSITVPVVQGEQIYASSFGKKGENGSNSVDGIRVAFLLSTGAVVMKTTDEVYTEYSKKGCIDIPAGAVAVSIPMWSNSDDWEIYIGKAAGQIGGRIQQLPESFDKNTNHWEYLKNRTLNERIKNGNWIALESGTSLCSVLIPVNNGMKINANSFQGREANGNSQYDGIRIAWIFEDGSIRDVLNDDVYEEFSSNGYVTAAEGAIAVNVVWWTGSSDNYLYLSK